MSEFDKHWNEWAIASNCPEDEAKIHFEAGQQSKQAEIDALKAKIDGAKEIIKHWHTWPRELKYGGNLMLDQLHKIEEELK